MILTIIKHGLPLDEVIYCEVMFDEHISGEYPEHAAFIHNKAIPILERCYGLKVTVLRDKTTYKENCLHIRTKGEKSGDAFGLSITPCELVQRLLENAPHKRLPQEPDGHHP